MVQVQIYFSFIFTADWFQKHMNITFLSVVWKTCFVKVHWYSNWRFSVSLSDKIEMMEPNVTLEPLNSRQGLQASRSFDFATTPPTYITNAIVKTMHDAKPLEDEEKNAMATSNMIDKVMHKAKMHAEVQHLMVNCASHFEQGKIIEHIPRRTLRNLLHGTTDCLSYFF